MGQHGDKNYHLILHFWAKYIRQKRYHMQYRSRNRTHSDWLIKIHGRSEALVKVKETNNFLPAAESWIYRHGREVQKL